MFNGILVLHRNLGGSFMSKKLHLTGSIFLLLINMFVFLFFMVQPFWNSLDYSTVLTILALLLTDFFICLIFQFQAHKKGNGIFYIWLFSLMLLSLIFLEFFGQSLHNYSVFYVLILICGFISFYRFFKQMKVRRLPYILLFILVGLPVLLFLLTSLFFYSLFSGISNM